jgi:uncharacterized protein (UPF0261 family)
MKTVAILGALDTKGADFAYLKAEIERRGCATLVIDFGVVGSPGFAPDITSAEVAAAGGASLEELVTRGDRGEAMAVMGRGAAAIAQRLHGEGKIDAIVSMGGGGGTSVAAVAMRALPIGFPKLIVSTLAGGDVSGFVGISDIVMMPAILDVNGVNRISRRIYATAAGAICGMAGVEVDAAVDKPVIAVTMFGNTTRAVNHAKGVLEAAGYEVLVFHATGTGGRQMEALIATGMIRAVLDLTTTEWADELLGGVLSAGARRLDAAGAAGIPQVVVPGCLDMCNFWARETVPERYAGRLLYEWNPNVTLMRTTPDECAQLGSIIAGKLNAAHGRVAVYIPRGGWSEIDLPGKPFHSPEAIEAFTHALHRELLMTIPIVEMPQDINDPEFAGAAANALLALINAPSMEAIL